MGSRSSAMDGFLHPTARTVSAEKWPGSSFFLVAQVNHGLVRARHDADFVEAEPLSGRARWPSLRDMQLQHSWWTRYLISRLCRTAHCESILHFNTASPDTSSHQMSLGGSHIRQHVSNLVNLWHNLATIRIHSRSEARPLEQGQFFGKI